MGALLQESSLLRAGERQSLWLRLCARHPWDPGDVHLSQHATQSGFALPGAGAAPVSLDFQPTREPPRAARQRAQVSLCPRV